MDYIFPNFLAKVLRTPSPRTQMESSLVGIAIMMLGSLCVTSYILINTDMSTLLKTFIAIGEIGILGFQWGLLSTTYIQYYNFKLTNGMYPADYKLQLLVDDAKRLKEELDKSIKENEHI